MKYQMIILLSCATSLLACKTLQQKWRNGIKVNTTSTLSWQKHDQLAQHLQASIRDSSLTGYVVEIIPRGKFTYSAVNGFSGEAQQLRIKGKTLHTTSRTVDQHTQATVKENMELRNQFKSSHSTLTKEKEKKLSWKWILAAILIGLAYYFYRRHQPRPLERMK